MPGAEPRGRFGADQRVRVRADFKRIQSKARRVHTRHFVLLLDVREPSGVATAPGPRLGITASRRVGSAVIRNRAKRLVREAFRSTRDLWPAGVDLVVIVKSALSGLSLNDVVGEWRAVAPVVAKKLGVGALDRPSEASNQ